MEKLITVRDVSERYGCSIPTARKYIRQCNPHMERPLATTVSAFRQWEEERTVCMPREMTKADFERMLGKIREGAHVIVPRRR